MKIISKDARMKEILIRENVGNRITVIVWKNSKQIEIIAERKRFTQTRTETVDFKDDEIDDLKKILDDIK